MHPISRLLVTGIASAGLALALPSPEGGAQTSKKAGPSANVQKEFDVFIAKFRAALVRNDAAAVTEMTRLPFFHNHAMIDATQFRATAYPAYFTAKARTCIQRNRAVHDRDGENNDNYFIFCGQRIFVFTRTPAGFRFAEVGVND